MRGVNLVGYLRAESGVGQVGRSMARVLEAAGIPYSLHLFDQTRSRQHHDFSSTAATSELYDTNLLCVNADQTPVFMEGPGAELTRARRNIGVWAWEVDVLPERMRVAGDLVDEAWGISQYTADCVSPWVSCPVWAMPLPVELETFSRRSRAELDIPRGFVVLSCFDLDSVLERKNPLAVLAAYQKAFPEPGQAHLVLKTINGAFHPEQVALLEEACGERPDIHFMDGYLPYERQLAMVAQCDVYVTLHRAEGFGLTLGEAMALGKPVVATGFSANLEFMNGSNSRLVDYERVEVGEGADPYPAEATWAEPCVDDAAEKLRFLFDDQQQALALGRRARLDIRNRHSAQARAPRLTELIEAADGRPGRHVSAARRDAGALRSLQHVEHLLARGPEVDRPSRLGAAARFWRRTALRLLQNYDVHAQETVRALVAAGVQSGELVAQLDARAVENARVLGGLGGIVEQLSAALDLERESRHATASREAQRVQRALTERDESLAGLAKQLDATARENERRLAAIEGRIENSRKTGVETLAKTGRVEREVANLRERQVQFASALEAIEMRLAALEDAQERTSRREQSSRQIIDDETQPVDAWRSSLDDQGTALLERIEAVAAATPWRSDMAHAGRRIEEVRYAVDQLTDELYCPPYMSAPEELIVERDGKKSLRWPTSGRGRSIEHGYPGFEDLFRGTFDFIRERQRIYLADLTDRAPILDFGCGRGEMLDVLREAGIEATGVDRDADQIERCRKRGLAVTCADGLEHLSSLADESLGAIFSAQVVEHLELDELTRLLKLASQRLRSDGILILETPNPHSPRALRSFWVDPTHRAPIFPETLLLLTRDHGFSPIEVRFPFGEGDYELDRRSQGEYALIAHKPPLTRS